MRPHGERIYRSSQEPARDGKPVHRGPWQGNDVPTSIRKPPTDQEVQAAAEQFRTWLRWYRDQYPQTAGTHEALAKLIGVTRPTVSLQLKPGCQHIPTLQTLMGFSRLVGYSIDHILTSPTPEGPKR